ncbi:e3 ubiquitin-protein ligase rnf149 [Stylonychia lemnae]|uniref:E3 ubiquitin-protein ligase rnf149 n=1 Tax=Stylonychia lemnae TaxID=5949 RepID=A0A078ANH3_STYLE|nr:e3 ubiquitin-protein ligase rnf149 [Stylonychia lemnae]|eukprot:CDW83885.1 e3 ubiquitin-protein ligase rnf149 [Stylonychia lemnae]
MPRIKSKKYLTVIRVNNTNSRVDSEVFHSVVESTDAKKIVKLEGFLFVYYVLYYLLMAILSFALFFTLDRDYETKYGFDSQLQYWYEIQQFLLLLSCVLIFFIARSSMKRPQVQYWIKSGGCCCSASIIVMPRSIIHKILVLIIEFANLGFGVFAIIVYFKNFNEIQTMLSSTKLIRLVVPSIAILDMLILVRMLTFVNLFFILPRLNSDNILTGRYKNEVKHKFPIVTLKQYQKQIMLKRSVSLDALNKQFICAICCEELKASDQIVVLSCNIKHFFNKNCIKKWLENHNTCPLCKEDVAFGGVINSTTESSQGSQQYQLSV